MLQLSNFPIKTLKSTPKVSDNKSTSLLLKAGFIRQTMAGVYEYLPLGLRVLRNIEDVIREEMDDAGYHETLMSILTPQELWETTDRWEIPEYFKVPGWGNVEYRIAPTNEENVTPIMKEFIQSYRDLPTCVYHIQKKFRNEKRAKSGLLRGREFIMKDAYSFHKDRADFEAFYEDIKGVYMKIFERLGLGDDTVIADADGGAISDKNSHEFQTFLSVGEDIIVQDSSGYSYNLEIASGIPDDKNSNDTELSLEYIDTVADIVNMEKMTAYFKAPAWQMLKTIVYKLEKSQKYVGVSIRGDLNVNELKFSQFIREKYDDTITLANEADLEKIGTIRGFISPLKQSVIPAKAGISLWDTKNQSVEKTDPAISYPLGASAGWQGVLNVDFYGDESLKTVKNFFWGANAVAKSTKNINLWDLDIQEFHDFNEPKDGFTSVNVPGEKLTFKRASEVGNIFSSRDQVLKTFWSDIFG